MSDLADVEITLEGLIAGWVYPNGTAQPSAAGGVPVKIVRGWPLSTDLQNHLAAKPTPVAYISIYSQPGSERLTTRYPREWLVLTAPSPTLSAAVTPGQAVFSGSISTPQNLAVVIAKKTYLHAVQPNDTLATIAAALAIAISADHTADSAGATLSVPGQALSVRVGGVATAGRELRRQERLTMITVWTATPEQRDVVAGFIDSKFAGAGDPNGMEFISLPDGFLGRLQYVRTVPIDRDELSGAFRRDLIYSVEYPTTEVSQFSQIVAFETTLAQPDSVVITDTFA